MSKLVDNFLKYVSYDTQSRDFTDEVPSTDKQFALAKELGSELVELGLPDVSVSEHGYVYATIPGNIDTDCRVIGFLAHMDTSPDCSGKDVKPQMITDYDGGVITLNEGFGIYMDPAEYPNLKDYTGKTLITTDGTTLLGADDKSGIAEIMTMAEILVNNPDIRHGPVKIAFTPDEEVGHGVKYFDVENWGADAAYTVDGGAWGEMEYETFNAASLRVTVHGLNIHPGTAKNKMKNSIEIAMEYDRLLPENERPQYTEGYEGFYHLNGISGNVEETVLDYIVRDHDRAKFESKKDFARRAGDFLNTKYGDGTVDVVLKDQYYNLADVIRDNMYLVDIVADAFRELGSEPKIEPVRGGTDGSQLSYMGIPCPNLCAGGQNMHGRFEFVCVEDMENIVQLLIKIAEKFADTEK